MVSGIRVNKGNVFAVALLGAVTRQVCITHLKESASTQPSPGLLDQREVFSLKHFPGIIFHRAHFGEYSPRTD